MSALAFARHLTPPPGLSRWAKPLLVSTLVVATIFVLAIEVFPTRRWIEQRDAIEETRAELAELDAQRDQLERQLERLDRDDQIEAIARSEYGLVYPGEEAYAIHPAPDQPLELPDVWPFGDLPPAG